MTRQVAAMAAMTPSRVIGHNGAMIWSVPGDVRLFQRYTMGRTLLMGSGSLPSLHKPLHGRRLVVLSRAGKVRDEWKDRADEVLVARSPEEALKIAAVPDPVVAGGGAVYHAMLHCVSVLWLTVLDEEFGGGNVTFPSLDPLDWEVTLQERHRDSDDPCAWTFTEYHRLERRERGWRNGR